MNLNLGPNLANTPHKTFPPKQGESAAAELNATDDWTYGVIHDPKGTGYSFIEMYHEDGEYIGRWT